MFGKREIRLEPCSRSDILAAVEEDGRVRALVATGGGKGPVTGHGRPESTRSWCLLGCWGGGAWLNADSQISHAEATGGQSKCGMSCEGPLLSVAFCFPFISSGQERRRELNAAFLPSAARSAIQRRRRGGGRCAGRAGVLANTGLTPPVLVQRRARVAGRAPAPCGVPSAAASRGLAAHSGSRVQTT